MAKKGRTKASQQWATNKQPPSTRQVRPGFKQTQTSIANERCLKTRETNLAGFRPACLFFVSVTAHHRG